MKFVLLLIFVTAALAGDNVTCPNNATPCDNPLYSPEYFDSPEEAAFWEEIKYMDCPATVDIANDICPEQFFEGDQQCCNAVVYQLIDTYWSILRAVMAESVEEARAAVNEFRQERANIDAARSAIRNSDELTELQKDALIQLLDDIVAALDNFIDNLVDSWESCASVILEYWAGLACLGCEANWDNYIDVSTVPPTAILDLETCNDLVDGCRGFFDALHELALEIAEATFNSANVLIGEDLINPVEDPCGEDGCDIFICDVMFNGVNVDDSAVGDDVGNRRAYFSNELLQRASSNLKALPKLKSFGIHDTFDSIVARVGDLHSKHGKIGTHVHVKTQTNKRNTFDVSGWRATSVGKASSLNTEVEGGAAAGLTSWMSVLP